jgi:hypothetical protein
MNIQNLRKLHKEAEANVKAAHQAYTIALKNRKADGDTNDAYAALIKANRVKDGIYEALLKEIVK